MRMPAALSADAIIAHVEPFPVRTSNMNESASAFRVRESGQKCLDSLQSQLRGPDFITKRV